MTFHGHERVNVLGIQLSHVLRNAQTEGAHLNKKKQATVEAKHHEAWGFDSHGAIASGTLRNDQKRHTNRRCRYVSVFSAWMKPSTS